jgi:hypothetical protein
MMPGRFFAYILADSRIFSAGTQAISATFSGVYSAARAASLSKPNVH